ncbi:hypothetical protein TWF718_006249 [Orbilia javanica]|uniref:protein disulfide-isomerase n=1 Tax=Orbilia javanica TaxID=47235 RepID=A0AAN8NY85_9PEZI
MVHNPVILAALSAALLAPLASGMYSSNSPVLQLTSKNFAEKILKSNHASVVEFYAPWCGHCKNLKPAYEKAAENMKGLAQVAAIDCDEDANKRTCSEYGIQGFPTIKVFKPGKSGKPSVLDYQGQRTAKGIVDFLIEQIPNHVARVNSKTVDGFLQEKNETAKAILFTTKGVATPLYKALAIDFFGSVTFAQVRDKETEVLKLFGVEKVPTFLVLPGGTAEGVVYDGEMKKDAMLKFVGKFAEPATGKPAAKDEKAESSSSSSAPPPPPRPTFDSTIPEAPSLETFAATCGNKICVLIVTPDNAPALAAPEKANFYVNHVKQTFPFFQVQGSKLSPEFMKGFGLDKTDQIQVRALSAKRGWYVEYNGDSSSDEELKAWIDKIKMGEIKKTKIPQFEKEPEPAKDAPAPEEPVKEAPKEAPEHEEL